MATTTANFVLGVRGVTSISPAVKPSRRQRSIDPQAGRALELLGHAIEYLADEYVHQGGQFKAGDAQVEAIQMLMALNREIYFACPVVPTLRERCAALVQRLVF